MAILAEFSREVVDAAVEGNFLSFMDKIETLPIAEVHRAKNIVSVVVPTVPHPVMNIVTQARFDGETDTSIRATMVRYTERDIPFLWQIEASTRPKNLGQRLEALGMQPLGQFPVMVVDLDTINETLAASEGYEIKHVTGAALLKAFGAVMQKGFQLPSNVIEAMLPLMYDESDAARVLSYVGFLNEEPVSAGTIIFGAGVAGFYNGTVVESARGKGIGTANALFRFAAAKERGYRIGFMISGGNAYNLYKRLGFKDYTPIERYLWMPSPPHVDSSGSNM